MPLISGKFKSGYIPPNNNENNIQESTPQYLARNIAKAPGVVYRAARSGLGLGDLQDMLLGKLGVPENVKQLIPGFQTSEGARKELEYILPKYATESRPEDYWSEFITREIPIYAATGGFSSVPNFLRSLASTGTSYAGSELGEKAGSYLTGDNELGGTIGSLLGSLGGVSLLHALPQLNAGKITEKAKSSSLSNIEQQKLSNLNNIEQKKLSALQNLENEKMQRLGKIKSLTEERQPLYAQAESASKGITHNAEKLLNGIQKIQDNISVGVEPASQATVRKLLGQIESRINNGTLSLEDAKLIKKNINRQIYDRNLQPGVKSFYSDIVTELNDFITEAGIKYPEHANPFIEAEKKHVELKQLQKETPEFNKKIKTQEKNAINEYNKSINDINKQYNKSISDIHEEYKFDNKIEPILSSGISETMLGLIGATLKGLTGVGYGVGISKALKSIKFAANEIKQIHKILSKHPEIKKDIINTFKNKTEKDIPFIINKLKTIDSKVQEYINNKKEPQGELISGRMKQS